MRDQPGAVFPYAHPGTTETCTYLILALAAPGTFVLTHLIEPKKDLQLVHNACWCDFGKGRRSATYLWAPRTNRQMENGGCAFHWFLEVYKCEQTSTRARGSFDAIGHKHVTILWRVMVGLVNCMSLPQTIPHT